MEINEHTQDFPVSPVADWWFIVPMVGGTYTPVYVSMNAVEIDCVCAEMNAAIGSDMFTTENGTTFHDRLNFSLYRDADRMVWVDVRHGDV